MPPCQPTWHFAQPQQRSPESRGVERNVRVMHLPRRIVRFGPMAMVALLAACGPSAPAQPGGSAPAAQPQAQTPKVLTIGLQRELAGFAEFESGGGGIAAPDIAHDVL